MNESQIINWLKKIFSIQTISLLVALVAAYFTYKSYDDNKPGDLTIEFPILNEEMDSIYTVDASNVSRYFSLGFYEYPPIAINDGKIAGADNMLLFPYIYNQSNKSLNNFSAKIHIWSNDINVLLNDSLDENNKNGFINIKDFNIIFKNESSIELSYNKDHLTANSVLPVPLSSENLYNGFYLDGDKTGKHGLRINFYYSITYDGIESPISFEYDAKLFRGTFEETNSDETHFSNLFMGREAYNYLMSVVFSIHERRRRLEDGEWIFIMNNKVYRNIKHLSPQQFKDLEDKSYSNLQNK